MVKGLRSSAESARLPLGVVMPVPVAHYTKKYLIPRTLQAVVCMCDEPGTPMFDYSHRAGPLMQCCSTCRKPYRWYVRICTACEKYFIKDFRRKADDCVVHSKCWDCMLNNDTCPCEKEHSTRADFGPLGFNPRSYTKEETAGVFDSGGPF